MEVQVKLVPSGIDEDGEEQHMELDAAIIDTLKPILAEAVYKKVNEVTDKVIKAIVEEHVAKLSVEAFGQIFQATDCWGKHKGEPKSLAEIVSGKVKGYLEAKVNARGDATYEGEPRIQWMVNRTIELVVQEETGKHLATLRAEFAKRIADKIANVEVS